MKSGQMALWGLEILAVWGALFAAQMPLRNRERPVARTLVFLIKALLIPLTAFVLVAVKSVLGFRPGSVLAAAYVVLIGDVAASAVEYVLRRLRQPRDASAGRRPCRQVWLGALSAVFCL